MERRSAALYIPLMSRPSAPDRFNEDKAAYAVRGEGAPDEATASRYDDRPLHSGFGGGVHHCLGHFVARTDMSVALPLLAQRMPDVAPDGPGEWLPVSGNTGPIRFPLRFTPER